MISSHPRLHLVFELWKVGPLVGVRFDGLPAAQIFPWTFLIIPRFQVCTIGGMVTLRSMFIGAVGSLFRTLARDLPSSAFRPN
jgi:hypothetical protein